MLIKHSNVEFGRTWWFLYRLERDDLDLSAAREVGLDTLRYTRAARFLKRFGSEEELELEAAVKYGEGASAVNARGRKAAL